MYDHKGQYIIKVLVCIEPVGLSWQTSETLGLTGGNLHVDGFSRAP